MKRIYLSSILIILLTSCQNPESKISTKKEVLICCSEEKPEMKIESSSGGSSLSSSFSSPLYKKENRQTINLDYDFLNHNGDSVKLKDSLGVPTVISFMYTRCTNPNMCEKVSKTMDDLRSKIKESTELKKVNLLLISYDPGYDTPKVLKQYASDKNFILENGFFMLRPTRKGELFKELGINVSFTEEYDKPVTIHDIQLILLDKKGAVAKTYNTILWKNEEVVETLKKISAENF